MTRKLNIVVVNLVLLTSASPTQAQSLSTRLSTLLTEQRSDPILATNIEAAQLTRDAVTSIFAVELATLPVASSSGGFVYHLNRNLGTIERASSGFGPFYTESVLRPGREQTGLSIRYQQSNFSSLQGGSLTDGTFPTNATRVVGATQPFSIDTLQLSIDARTVSLVGTHGLSDRLSVGGVVPLQTVRFSGRRTRQLNGVSSLQSSQSGTSTGVGDIAMQTRYRLVDRGSQGLSVGGDVRLPTGRSEDLLGAGKASARVMAIGSWERDQLALHVNGGGGVGGLSRDYFFSMAGAYAASPRVTIIGEWLGRRLSELTRIQDVYQPVAGAMETETMRWLPVDSGINTSFVVVGSKWNVTRSVLINANVLVRMSESGLRARTTPTISLDVDLQR